MDVASEIALCCRCLLIGVFALSVLAKLRNPAAWRAFAASLVGLRLVPAGLSRPVAAAVTAAELAVLAVLAGPTVLAPGAVLASGPVTAEPAARSGSATTALAGGAPAPAPMVAMTAGFLVAAALLVVLSAGLVIALSRGAVTPCRCFGASRRRVGPVHVVRNAVLLLVALAGAGATLTGSGPLSPVAAVPAVVAAAAGLLGLHYLDDVAALFDPVPSPPSAPAHRRPTAAVPGRPPRPARQEPAHQALRYAAGPTVHGGGTR
jgi:hypothetical protein